MTIGNDKESEAEVRIYPLRRRDYGSWDNYRAICNTEH